MNRGKFITIEGSEGAGKSTALRFVHDMLASRFEVVTTREPGGTVFAEAIRNMLLNPFDEEKIFPETELLLMFAARFQHLHHFILPQLKANKWVVCDRFVDASYAYQGGGRLLKEAWIASLDKMVVDNAMPDLTLLLDIPVQLGFERAAKRGGKKDRIESEKIDFFERVRTVYLARAAKDPARIKIIDASASLDRVQQQIAQVLEVFFREQSS